MSNKLPTLYKKTSTGALQEWAVEVDGGRYRSHSGQVGGAITVAAWTDCKGKNVGRANATTPEQQAALEAKAKWIKKLKGDYVKTKEEAMAGGSSDLVAGGILPMLAHRFDKREKYLTYPCACQMKYDGHRCIAVIDAVGKCSLWSRTRKSINSLPHVVAAVEALGLKSVALDGEAYSDGYHDRFEQLTHFIRQAKPITGAEVVHYHIYDAIRPGSFLERLTWLRTKLEGVALPLVLAKTETVGSKVELFAKLDAYVELGMEGAIARNLEGEYECKRSSNLLKLKLLYDKTRFANEEEFEIIGVKQGVGKLAGCGIFQVRVTPEITASAKMEGPLADLRKYWEHQEQYVGKSLTIRFPGYTAEGSLRFPVAVRVVAPL